MEAMAQRLTGRFRSVLETILSGPLIAYRPIDAATLARRLVQVAMVPELERLVILEGGALFRTSVESTAPGVSRKLE
jgi:hypothetical protein